MNKFLLLILLLISCQTDKKNIIPVDNMVLILKDMHIAQTYLYEQRLGNEERIQKSKQLYHSILKKYNVSKEDFYQSMNYYSEHIQEFDSIYKLMIESTYKPDEN